MLGFITSNWATFVIILATIIFIGFLVYTKQWDRLRLAAYKAMLAAERAIKGTRKGQERFEEVFKKLYSLIPGWLQFFISEKSLRERLQKWFDKAKDYLDDGHINQSI